MRFGMSWPRGRDASARSGDARRALDALGERELEPEILPAVMGARGIGLPPTDLADVASRLVHAPDEPVRLDHPPDVAGRQTLLAWGVFNPFGPTALRLDLVPVQPGGTAVLALCLEHPFTPAAYALAALPMGADAEAGAAAIRHALVALFARNGHPDVPLMGCPPSYIHVPPGSPLDAADVAQLFAAALAAVEDVTGEAIDYRGAYYEAVASWVNPWDVARAAVADWMRRPASLAAWVDLGDDQPEPGRDRPADGVPNPRSDGLPDPLSDGLPDAPADLALDPLADLLPDASAADVTDAFTAWLRLVSHPAFVQHMAREMECAWDGAQTFAFGAGDLPMTPRRSPPRPWPGLTGPA